METSMNTLDLAKKIAGDEFTFIKKCSTYSTLMASAHIRIG